MSRKATTRSRPEIPLLDLRGALREIMLFAALAFAGGAFLHAQQIEWRPVGSAVLDAGLAAPASGTVTAVWFSPDGSVLYARTPKGRVLETSDFERWETSAAVAPDRVTASGNPPESGARVWSPTMVSPRRYALGAAVYRSDDEGSSWRDVSRFRGRSILGGGLTDLAISPVDPDEVVVAGRNGVWRSLDGGITWSGLNEALPNLPVRRIVSVRPMRIALDDAEALWKPGSKAWHTQPADQAAADERLRTRLSPMAGFAASHAVTVGEQIYVAGAARISASPDAGRSWRPFAIPDNASVLSIFALRSLPTTALASISIEEAGVRTARILRTINGGIFWDDVTAGLPSAHVNGLAADLETGAIYAAADEGLFVTYGDLRAASPASPWRQIELPAAVRQGRAAIMDVRLDDAGNQLYVAVDGHGVFATMAPHRARLPKVVNAADRSERAAAPGALLSVLGRRVTSIRSGELDVPVLAASAGETQIQVPFEASGTSLSLALGGASEITMPLLEVSPAIFQDRDGVPMILDADTGTLLEPGRPARAGSRIQILATGLGRVTPNWPTGLAAPATNPPRVISPVRVLLDRSPIEVTRATLAPGFAGFYLIEVQLPDVVNAGPAELAIEMGTQRSTAASLPLVQ